MYRFTVGSAKSANDKCPKPMKKTYLNTKVHIRNSLAILDVKSFGLNPNYFGLYVPYLMRVRLFNRLYPQCSTFSGWLDHTLAIAWQVLTFGWSPLKVNDDQLMSVKHWFTASKPCKKFSEPAQLFAGLQTQDERAILCLQTKALPMVMKQVLNFGLNREQGEDIMNRATLIFLQKIENGSYVFQGHALTTYLIEVAKRLAMAAARKSSKHQHQELEENHLDHLGDFAEHERRESAADMVRQLLGRLNEACAKVIRLHHIDGYRDDEVIEQGLTPYSTVNSLKMKRSNCMKQLIKIAQEWKTSTTI